MFRASQVTSHRFPTMRRLPREQSESRGLSSERLKRASDHAESRVPRSFRIHTASRTDRIRGPRSLYFRESAVFRALALSPGYVRMSSWKARGFV